MKQSKDILAILKEVLEVDTLTLQDSVDTIEEWDSLTQLSLLVAIDKELDGMASGITELGTATSVETIIDCLVKAKLIEK